MEQSIGLQAQNWFKNAGCWVAARQAMQGSPKAIACPRDLSSTPLVQSGAMEHAMKKRYSLPATGAAWRWRQSIPSTPSPSRVSVLEFMDFRLKRPAQSPFQPRGLSSRKAVPSTRSYSVAFRRATSGNTKACSAGSRIDCFVEPKAGAVPGPEGTKQYLANRDEASRRMVEAIKKSSLLEDKAPGTISTGIHTRSRMNRGPVQCSSPKPSGPDRAGIFHQRNPEAARE